MGCADWTAGSPSSWAAHRESARRRRAGSARGRPRGRRRHRGRRRAADRDRIVAAGGTAIAVAFDLADPASVADAVRHRRDTYGGVDASSRSARTWATLAADTDVVDIELDLWDRVMAVNLRGYVCAMKYAIPAHLARRRRHREHVVGRRVPG